MNPRFEAGDKVIDREQNRRGRIESISYIDNGYEYAVNWGLDNTGSAGGKNIGYYREPLPFEKIVTGWSRIMGPDDF
jgi:hypothetical protein